MSFPPDRDFGEFESRAQAGAMDLWMVAAILRNSARHAARSYRRSKKRAKIVPRWVTRLESDARMATAHLERIDDYQARHWDF